MQRNGKLELRISELEAENAQLRRAGFYLLSFVPEWAKGVPDGLDPTMYGTLTAVGDRQVKTAVDAIRALLTQPAQNEGDAARDA